MKCDGDHGPEERDAGRVTIEIGVSPFALQSTSSFVSGKSLEEPDLN